MKNRLEYKYLVPLIYLDKLRANLSIYLEPDEYAAVRPSREYTVHSIYLDGFDYRCYYEKIDGVHTRKKFRIRGYNKEEDRSPVFFEIKRKHDNFISKDRAGVAHRDVGVALVDHRIDVCINGEERCSLSNFYHYHELRHLEPKILVVYEREPFECKFGSKLRITIDKHLRSKIVSGYEDLFDDSGLAECFRKVFILEVKFFQALPQWIGRVLEKYDLTRMAVSKYTCSIDAQHSSSVTFNKFTQFHTQTGHCHAAEPPGDRPLLPDAVANYS
jgi:hypothetical protein